MKKRLIFVPIILACFLMGCAGVQQKWEALTPDLKARVVINDLQGQLDNLFTQGKAYVTKNPSVYAEWKVKVVPAFSVANKALADVILIGRTKTLTPDMVYAKAQGQINNVVALLAIWGIK